MTHNNEASKHASCEGQCGKVVHFTSRTKLFKHLREKHGVGGFSRRGRESRSRRQEARAHLHTQGTAKSAQRVQGPHRQWVRVPIADVIRSPANGVSSPAKASFSQPMGSSPGVGAISPEVGATMPSPAKAPQLRRLASLPSGLRPGSLAMSATSPAKASTPLGRAPSSPAEAPLASGDMPLQTRSPVQRLQRLPKCQVKQLAAVKRRRFE